MGACQWNWYPQRYPRGKRKKLLDQTRDLLRLKHYSIRTEQACTDWIRRFILFHGKRDPRETLKAQSMRCSHS